MHCALWRHLLCQIVAPSAWIHSAAVMHRLDFKGIWRPEPGTTLQLRTLAFTRTQLKRSVLELRLFDQTRHPSFNAKERQCWPRPTPPWPLAGTHKRPWPGEDHCAEFARLTSLLAATDVMAETPRLGMAVEQELLPTPDGAALPSLPQAPSVICGTIFAEVIDCRSMVQSSSPERALKLFSGCHWRLAASFAAAMASNCKNQRVRSRFMHFRMSCGLTSTGCSSSTLAVLMRICQNTSSLASLASGHS